LILASPFIKKGFSLVELLVVLSLLSLVTAMAMPNLSKMYSSFSSALEISEVVRQINGIGYQVNVGGREFNLQGVAANKGRHNIGKVEFNLPQGWSIELEKALRYASSGACTGGYIKIFFADELRQAQQLKAPFCQVEM